jgi:hypothetical protein
MKRHLITLYLARPAIWCWLAHRKWRSEINKYRGGAIRHCDRCDLTWVSLDGVIRVLVETAVMLALFVLGVACFIAEILVTID